MQILYSKFRNRLSGKRLINFTRMLKIGFHKATINFNEEK